MKAEVKQNAPAVEQFEVTRSFYYEGKVMEQGSTYTLPRLFAIEMQAAKKGRIIPKVEPAPQPQAPAEEPKQAATSDAEKPKASNAGKVTKKEK